MASVRQTQTVHYDNYMNNRKRTLRFLQDNRDTFLDYPENTQHRVDLEDSLRLDYYIGPFSNYCFYTGLASTIAISLGVIFLHRQDVTRAVKLVSMILPMFPMVGSTFVHYQVSGQFLDYCTEKYQERGLWDVELWEFHKKQHAPGELVKEWKIGR